MGETLKAWFENLKRWALPFIAGIAVCFIIMVTLLDYMTEGAANTLADERADEATKVAEVVTATILVPQCVANAQADETKLAEVLAISSSFSQRREVEGTDWVVVPEGASDTLTRSVTDACIAALK